MINIRDLYNIAHDVLDQNKWKKLVDKFGRRIAILLHREIIFDNVRSLRKNGAIKDIIKSLDPVDQLDIYAKLCHKYSVK